MRIHLWLAGLLSLGLFGGALGACSSDDDAPPVGGASGASSGAGGSSAGQGGSGQGGSGGEAGGAEGEGGTSGQGGASGASGQGAGGEPPLCPGAAAPTVVSELAGAVFPAPGGLKGGETPLLDMDAPDPGWTWNDPHVVKVGDEFWMYASATDKFQFPVRLYRLVSKDGSQWTRNPSAPILDVGPAGSWDAGGVETPAVVFFGGQFHLFYTAYPIKIGDPGHLITDFRVGHATSCDGVTWKREDAPILAPSGTSDNDPSNDWYAFIVGEPGPVVHDGKLLLYFTALGVNAALGKTLQVIGVTTSEDGTTWTPPVLALEPDQALYPRVTEAGPPVAGWVGYSTPSAISLNGSVHLFVDVAFDPDEAHWTQTRLHHATSNSGLTGWTQDAAALASRDDFSWTKNEIRAPGALIDGSTLRLYFAGHELDGSDPEHFGIGLMTAPLLP